MTPADLRQALPLFDDFVSRFAPLLGDDSRPDRARAYLRGLLLDNDDNKTAEAIALKVYGDPSQVRMMQVFVSQSPWDDAPLRHELLRGADAELGRDDGILIFDESSFPKCGPKSVGVARQYCGALGKIANCQVAVYVAYASDAGHTLLDTRLYLPDEWTDDPDRCRRAGVPEGVVFRTKPELAFELLLSCREQLRHSWVTFDEVYGRDPGFVSGLEELGERYIGEVPKDTRVWLQRPQVQEPGPGRRGAPRRKPRVAPGEPPPQTVEEVAKSLPPSAWRRLGFREGTKGKQYAQFARVRVVAERDDLPGPELWLVIERGCEQQTGVKYYLSNAAKDCPLLTLARVAHTRWPIEDCFLRGKDELGLGDYEVQGWRGWHHHQTLVLLALWFLVLQQRRLGKKSRGRDDAA
ncbi:MAG TPA: IS701 family transposase [Gemmataceae bacterium]|jgi:SRSO17 transposase|nr:IS701 family transposase [Gemmataceae bacterium]